MLIFKKLTRFLRMHEESWFGPEQTEQNSIDEIAIITFGQLYFPSSYGSEQIIEMSPQRFCLYFERNRFLIF